MYFLPLEFSGAPRGVDPDVEVRRQEGARRAKEAAVLRLLFYSHDSYGLGHVRRTIAIAETLIADFHAPSALVLTGSPRSHYFRYPAHCDYLKLPSVTKAADGRYISREIDLALEETVSLRSRLILEAARSFRPRIFLADHTPDGLGGEILPALEALRGAAQPVARVFGMRDIIDEPEAVRLAWRRNGVVDVLRRSYDLILVYGQRDLFDPIAEYGLPDDLARRMVFTGYVGGLGSAARADEIRGRFAPATGRLVAVTVGGGGDGNLLLRSFLEGYERFGANPPFEALLVTGPLMSPRKRARFLAWAGKLRGVRAREYDDDLPGLYRASDLVVAMGGYNTICELAAAGARALIVPRVFPRREQWLRARRLAERGILRVLSPDRVSPETLLREIVEGLEAPVPPRGWGLDLSGLERISDAVAALVCRDQRQVRPHRSVAPVPP